jgi:hypothetical protein
VLPNRSTLLPYFVYLYIYIYIFFCFFCFFHTQGGKPGQTTRRKKILQARWLLVRRGMAGADFCLGRSRSYQNGTRAAIAGRVAESVSVPVATRAKRRLFSLFFVFFDQRMGAAGETERWRLVFQGLEKKTLDQQ